MWWVLKRTVSMDKKKLTILRWKFCLSKPMILTELPVSKAISFNLVNTAGTVSLAGANMVLWLILMFILTYDTYRITSE